MLSPKDLELPGKFGDWRPGQFEQAARVSASKKFMYFLDAPTGSGKSLIATAAQRLTGRGMTYVCTTKQLQDQLLHDFPYARTLKGRSNYPCAKFPSLFPKVSAEECTQDMKNKCNVMDKCQYLIAKKQALAAELAVLNTSYFLSEVNWVGAFSKREFLTIDEVDTLEDQLMGFIELVITQRQLNALNIPPPKYKTKFEAWIEWADITIKIIVPELLELQRELNSDWSTIDFSIFKRERALARLLGKLRFFREEVDKNWVWYPGEDRWSFKPVWVGKYAQKYLWKHADRILGMSATILDPRQVCVNVGLIGKPIEYKALPSPFPKENRPVYYEPCANVVNRNMNVALPKLVKAVSKILDDHPNDKILIHTVSYKIMTYLKDHISGTRLVTHTTADRAHALEFFKHSERPLALISPSMDRGVDLPYEECRVVVIVKCPYPDLGDAQVNKRVHASKDGNRWYAHKTVSKIVQMAGRGVRSADDYAATYILDEQFERLYNEYKEMFPGWFRQAIVM